MEAFDLTLQIVITVVAGITAQVIAEFLKVPSIVFLLLFGVLLGFGMLFPNTELMLLFPPIPLKAKYFVMIYGAIEFYLAMRQTAGDNVAHYAHIGGMIFGYLLLKYWQKNPKAW